MTRGSNTRRITVARLPKFFFGSPFFPLASTNTDQRMYDKSSRPSCLMLCLMLTLNDDSFKDSGRGFGHSIHKLLCPLELETWQMKRHSGLSLLTQGKSSKPPRQRIAMDLSRQFNLTGVNLYNEGQGDEAFEMFHASLQIMLRTMGKTTADMGPELFRVLALQSSVQRALSLKHFSQGKQKSMLQEVTNKPEPKDYSSPKDEYTSCVAPETRQHFNRQRISEQDPCIFKESFALSGSYHYDYRQYVVAVAADLYNMALILQQGYVNNKLSNCYERALVLYSFSGELLWNNLGHDLLRTNLPGGALLARLYCAILNNAGYLLLRMGHFEWARLFSRRLYEFLELLEPAGNAEEQHDRNTFQLNAVLLHRPQSTAAAA